MMKFEEVKPLDKAYLEQMGFSWHTDKDGSSYIADKLVCVSKSQANAYYDAANELYDMYVKAAENVIENNRFDELDIPFNLVEAIKLSWENDVHWHLLLSQVT